MAYFFGNNTGYLYRQLDKYVVSSLTLWVGIMGIFILATIYNILNRDKYLITYSMAFGLVVVFLLFKKYFRKWTGKTFSFMKGIKGEAVVGNILTQLSNEYSVYKNLTIPGVSGDLDYVVVGPTGIYAIEVKSRAEVIEYDGNQLTKYGEPFPQDFLDKLQNQYWVLHNYITKETGYEVYVLPVLVFSNHWTKVRFGLQKINHTYVIGIQWLLKTFEQNQWHKYQQEKAAVNQVLNELVKPNNS